MAGTIPSLALSTQFDKNGNLLAGGKVYFRAANSDTPQNAFQDTGLTIVHPNPITLGASGRVPMFYVADGSIRCRVTDRAGVVQFDEANLLVIGPSGGGGGGSSVDATTIFKTGDTLWVPINDTRGGWVRMNGRTIGSTSSGASERANADCQALHAYLWQNFSDAKCPVIGGRGANAAADWAANKWITLPNMRGRVPHGLDGMGNSRANVITDASVSGSDAGDTAAAIGGNDRTTIVQNNLPNVKVRLEGAPTLSVSGIGSGKTSAGFESTEGVSVGFGGSGGGNFEPRAFSIDDFSVASNANVKTQSLNGGVSQADLSNMAPFMLGTWYIKL